MYYMCVHMHISVCIHMHIYIHTYAYMCIHIYTFYGKKLKTSKAKALFFKSPFKR